LLGDVLHGTILDVIISSFYLGCSENALALWREDLEEVCTAELLKVEIYLTPVIHGAPGIEGIECIHRGYKSDGLIGLMVRGFPQYMKEHNNLIQNSMLTLASTITDEEVMRAKNCQELLVYHNIERQAERIHEIAKGLYV